MLRLAAAIALACGMMACDAGLASHHPAPGTEAGVGGGAGDSGEGGASGCAPGRFVLTNSVTNARDLGGTPLADGGVVACGAIFRGPPLAGFEQPACDDFARLGIRTVIDLRQESERISKPESNCVVAGASIVTAPLPIPYGLSPTDYIADLNTLDSMALIVKTLGTDAAYPVYVHCTWGRDRTGVVSAVVLLALGASRDAIMQEYLLSQPLVGAYPTSLKAVLDEIERQGGIEAYLGTVGVTPEQLATLRARRLGR
jgi:protein-tyrosine phosphatase